MLFFNPSTHNLDLIFNFIRNGGSYLVNLFVSMNHKICLGFVNLLKGDWIMFDFDKTGFLFI